MAVPFARPGYTLARLAVPCVAALLLSHAPLHALELPPVFGDHMVLQRGVPARIWGRDEPGARVVVQFAGQTHQAIADAGGGWRLTMDALETSSTGRLLTVAGAREMRRFDDVLVGDVWLCTGQSNMRFMLKQATGGAEAARHAADEGLRLLNFTGQLGRGISATNYFSTRGWQVSGPSSAGDFSAVAWFFGRKLRLDAGLPVGLLLNAVGGAPIEAFLPPETIAADAVLRDRTAGWTTNAAYPRWCRERAAQEMARFGSAPFHPYAPSALHTAGMRSLQPFALRGILWYQGESNATETPESPALDTAPYAHMFERLVADWRQAWAQPELPVLFAQLPALNRDWAPFRSMQEDLTNRIAHCGMVVTTDVGHPTDVHPPNKQPVGERLAGLALRLGAP